MNERWSDNKPPLEDNPEEILKGVREDQEAELEADEESAERAGSAADEIRGIDEAGIEAEQEQLRKEVEGENMPLDDLPGSLDSEKDAAQDQRDAISEGAD